MTNKTRIYLHGALAAVLNGVAGSGVVVMVDPVQFNLFQGGFTKLLVVCASSAVFGLLTFLKEHPLPDVTDEDFVTAAKAKVDAIVAKAPDVAAVAAISANIPNS
jgi:hypothetical protein